jgi:tryptophan synthase beta subunit
MMSKEKTTLYFNQGSMRMGITVDLETAEIIAKAIKENPQMEESEVIIQTLERLDKEDKEKKM